MFDFTTLKCQCGSQKQDPLKGIVDMSVGETLIQYYYLSQRQLHSEANQSSNLPKDNCVSESTKMSLPDVMRVKRMADNINFMRVYYLKSSKQVETSLEIIDCIMAIFLFEMTRTTKCGLLVNRDQLQYKILHFFSSLTPVKSTQQKDNTIDEIADERTEDSLLSQLIDDMSLTSEC